MTDYEFMLEDRIAKIQAINEQYDLEHNAYISFSGGKDSTILHYLIDMALPNNNIPRVYANTGIEYKMVREYVKELAKTDDRIIILNQTRNIKQTLEKYGYPFKSKEHSKKLEQYHNNGNKITHYLKMYLDENDNGNFKSKYKCPKMLKYQFTPDFKLHCSHLCCNKLKKDLIHRWQKESKRVVCLTGMRKEEGGQRANINCVIKKNNQLVMFHPLLVVNEDWENQFLNINKIKLCDLYYPPYSFKRTGCKGCPFALDLQNQLDVMRELLPNEYKQCEILWKPVYDEYRRIGYRLSNKIEKQMTIWDVMNE